jgi:hypothetical protein
MLSMKMPDKAGFEKCDLDGDGNLFFEEWENSQSDAAEIESSELESDELESSESDSPESESSESKEPRK